MHFQHSSTNAGQKMIASDGEKRKSVVKKWDGGKFGTQADKPRVIKVFRFGEKNDEGDTVVLNYRKVYFVFRITVYVFGEILLPNA